MSRENHELESYKQTSGELCDTCGWRFVIPPFGCANCRLHVRLAQERKADDARVQEVRKQKHYPAPNDCVYTSARRVLAAGRDVGLTCDQLAADCMGGIGIYYRVPGLCVWVSILNDDGMSACTMDYSTGTNAAFDIEDTAEGLAAAMVKIRSFLGQAEVPPWSS